MAKSKYEWRRQNNLRMERGENPLTWKEFVSENPENKGGHPMHKRLYNFAPPPEKEILRPAAVYDNKSPYDKYGV
jgi:hypothetical protein